MDPLRSLRVDRDLARPRLVGELAVVALLLFGYDRVAALVRIQPRSADVHGRGILAAEDSVGIDVEHALNAAVVAHEHLGKVLALYYNFAHAIVTFGALGAVYVLAASGYRRARRALVIVNLAGLVMFALMPVTPPRLLPEAGFVDVVALSHTWGAWDAASPSAVQHTDLYASMPSLHVAWATWVVLAAHAATSRRAWRTVATGHLVATVVIVLVTGNHYLLDVVAGALLALGAWALAGDPKSAEGGLGAAQHQSVGRTRGMTGAAASCGTHRRVGPDDGDVIDCCHPLAFASVPSPDPTRAVDLTRLPVSGHHCHRSPPSVVPRARPNAGGGNP